MTNPATPRTPPAGVRRVVIVHGYAASPQSHWFPWLAGQLTAAGVEVDVVQLPDPDRPDSARWEAAIDTTLGRPDDHTWIVAHSLGCLAALRVLAGRADDWRLGGVVLVAGFTGRLVALPVLDAFTDGDIDLQGVRAHVTSRIVVRSDNDAYVPTAATDHLAHRLEAPMIVEPTAGHFLADDGMTQLPLVLNLIRTANNSGLPRQQER